MTARYEFEASIDKWLADLEHRLDELVVNVAFAIAENIIVGGRYSPGSPVDTGFFRASWQVGLDALPAAAPSMPPSDVSKDVLRATHLNRDTLGQMSLMLIQAKAGMRVFIVNPVAYGPKLEFGWSQQAPRGMVRITLANGQALVDDTARKMLSNAA